MSNLFPGDPDALGDEWSDPDLDLLDDPFAGIDPDELAAAVSEALAELRYDDEFEKAPIVLAAMQLGVMSKAGREKLWQIVETADPNHLPILLVALINSGGDQRRVRRFLLTLLEDADPRRVASGVSGLKFNHDHKAFKRILALRDHPSPIVRASVVAYRREMRDWECLPVLVEASQDPAPEVRRAAVAAVTDLSVVATSDEVRRALERVRGKLERWQASELLNGNARGNDELFETVEDALGYSSALGHDVDWRDVEAAEREYPEAPLFAYIAIALSDPNDSRLRQRISALWDSEDSWERYSAITLMTILNDTAYEPQILALRGSEDQRVSQAAYMYQRMRDPAGALPELLRLLGSNSSAEKLFAMSTLSGFYAAEVDEDIRGWLGHLTADEDRVVRSYAEYALLTEWERRFAPPDVPVLGPYWSDPETL